MPEKSLAQYAPGEKGVIRRIFITGTVKKRLIDMGVTPGAEITMRKTAPLGDPIEISVRGYELSIRKAEAGMILMSAGEA